MAALLFAAQFIRPARTNPETADLMSLASHARVTPEVEEVLRRSCADCHSNQTRWPWYSNVAPVSWFVIDHVNEGRRELNFSAWGDYEPREAAQMLEAICVEARYGFMPLTSYTLVHRAARLSERDVNTLCEWTEAEAARLASTGQHRLR
ncbi:MAG TPA: heme-binding domain-containing protein [Pyrinomonadaceae bacterium]|nr:heme-binding domain-containing protein [Pyrinomonadaceae bacterium]